MNQNSSAAVEEFNKALYGGNILEEIAERCEDIRDDIEVLPDWQDNGALLGIKTVALDQSARLRDIAHRLSDFRSRLTKLVEEARADTAKAFGGCTKCYGKGYATQRETAGGGKKVWILSQYRPCSCDRGKQFAEALQWAKADMKAKCLIEITCMLDDFEYGDALIKRVTAAIQALPISNE